MDWQQRYIENDTPWDKGEPAPELKRLLQVNSPVFNKIRSILVPGCGTGHDAGLLADFGFHVTGLDISQLALQYARKRYQQQNIKWENANLFSELPDATYDMVWEHTCFCAIEPEERDNYVNSIAQTLKPDAVLLGVFFIETGLPEGEGPPYKTSINTIKEHFSKRFTLESETTPEHAYKGREGKEHLMLFRLNSNHT